MDRECLFGIKKAFNESEVLGYTKAVYSRRHFCKVGCSEIHCKVTGNL